MVEIAKKSTRVNSLWSICYCLLVLGLQGYITYLVVSKYRKYTEYEWAGSSSPVLSFYIVFVVLSLLCVPFFVLTSVLKVGNYANDGIKLGRDHALGSNSSTVCNKIKNEIVKRLWRHCWPFSQALHLTAAFFLLLPEVLLTALEIHHGLSASDAVWKSDLDFLFAPQRAHQSDLIGILNITHAANTTYMIKPTPSAPPGGWTPEHSLTAAFVNLAAALFAFSVRYAAVFWYTNKILSCVFALQLLFLTVNSLFAFCGMSILYKLSVNYKLYQHNISIALGPGAVLTLYLLGGLIMLLSTMAIFEYGSYYFQEKFKLVDKKHHPDAYVKQTIVVKSMCQGYIPHSCAMVALVVLAICKGPIAYDLVSMYRVTSDQLSLTCVILDVCYMIFWIIFWCLLTIKQQWQFRILDYAPLGQPIFTIQNHSIYRNPSSTSGSMDLQELHRIRAKRPSSLPSIDLTPSESGFDDGEALHSSDDGSLRAILPTVTEYPAAEGSEDSRHSSQNGVLSRKSRNRRSGHQRVTFDKTVKGCASTDDENSPKHHRSSLEDEGKVNVMVDVHSAGAVSSDKMSPTKLHPDNIQKPQNTGRLTPVKNFTSTRPVSLTNSSLMQDFRNSLRNHPSDYFANINTRSGSSTSSDEAESCNSEPGHVGGTDNFRRGDSARTLSYHEHRKNNNVPAPRLVTDWKSNIKPSNLAQAENTDLPALHRQSLSSQEVDSKRNSESSSGTQDVPFTKELTMALLNSQSAYKNSKAGTGQPNNVGADKGNYLYPRPLHFVVRKPEIGRRDSANYSLTSSQETSSNDSDQGHALCSQV